MLNIISKCIKPLKILSDNIDDEAIINMLNAKLANMITLTGVKFKQYENGIDRFCSYYGINFMGSGEKKDFTLGNINAYLLPFVKEYIQKKNEEFKEDFYYRNIELETNKRKKTEAEKKYEKIRVANFELEKVNSTGFYKEAEQSKNINLNSLFVRISELGDYLENANSGNASKKEFWQSLKTYYEGTIPPSIIATEGNRAPVENMTVQLIGYTDFSNLYDKNLKKMYLGCLKTGDARRTFFYMDNKKDKKIGYPIKANIKNENISKLKEISKELKNIFEVLLEKENKTYIFSEDADDLIYKHICESIDYFNDNPNVDPIIRLEVKESFWKIQKLSVIYCAIDNPYSNIVTSKYVQYAIDFYNSIKDGLLKVIQERELTLTEKYALYFYQNKDKEIRMMDLRKLGYICQANFTKKFNELVDDIKEILNEEYNLTLLSLQGAKNNKIFTLVNNVTNDDFLI